MPRIYHKKFLASGELNPLWRPDRRRGDRHANRKRARGRKVSKWDAAEFLAWDSEGADIDGRHEMILLANSKRSYIESVRGISSAEALTFMATTLASRYTTTHVGFAFGYDVNMILRDVQRHLIERLWNGEAIVWRNDAQLFRLEYKPRKSFMVHVRKAGKWRGGIVWDVFGFFQSSFVKALGAYNIEADIDAIQKMKEERPKFRPEMLEEIRAYCIDECALLVELMNRLRKYLEQADLKVSRWDGAGACAAAMLRRYKVKQYAATGPADDAARYAYFGGRAELLKYGHEPKRPIWRYDIISAYPAATVDLPCLACGEWVHGKTHGFSPEPFALYRVRWNFERGEPLYPLPWRTPDGRVYFPPVGEGWYWAPEVEAAFDHAQSYSGEIEIVERWIYAPACTHAPFAFVPQVFRQRREYKCAGIGAEKALKLAINSLYGKLAQQAGGRIRAPAYHCLPWAGYITSATRARLYRASMHAPDAIIMLATDGIFSTERLPLEIGTELGAWEETEFDGITVVQSGVYFVGEKVYHRGFDAGSLSRAEIVEAWRRGATRYNATHTRFVGMGQALQGESSWAKWRTWRTEPRAVRLRPEGTKRRDRYARPKPHVGFVDTWPLDPWPWRERGEILSTPIMRPWDKPFEGAKRLDAEGTEYLI